MLTARHVVVDAILDKSQIECDGAVLSLERYTSAKEDCALLKFEKTQKPVGAIPLFQGELSLSLPVVLVGNRDSRTDSCLVGRISRLDSEDPAFFEIDFEVRDGASGAFVYSMQGELIGIVQNSGDGVSNCHRWHQP